MSERARKTIRRESGSVSETGRATVTAPVAAVVWVDSTPLLRAEALRLRASKKKLEVAEQRVKAHKQSDEPAYQQWFNATFAQRLAEIRGLYEKLASLDSIVHRVEREILATGCSAAEAHARVMRDEDEMTLMEKLEAEEAARREAAGEDGLGEDGESDSAGDSQSDSRGDDSGEDGESARESSRALGSADDGWRPGKKQAATDTHIKAVYRQLVRRLHPDLNPDLPEEFKERWFEVQQAYEERDLARLESLLAACEEGGIEGDDSFIDKIQSLSRLKALFKSVTKKLKQQQRVLQQLKKAPAWDFSKVKRDPRKLAWLERDVKFELKGAEDTLAGDIRTLEYQISKWSRATEPAPAAETRRTGISRLSGNIRLTLSKKTKFVTQPSQFLPSAIVLLREKNRSLKEALRGKQEKAKVPN